MNTFVGDPASLTIDKLKSDLKKFSITVPAGAKKDVYVQLYKDKILAKHPKLEFSSDEEASPKVIRKKKPKRTDTNDIHMNDEMDPSSLTDVQLSIELKSLGAEIGPITETTRRVYEKKLMRMRDARMHTEGAEAMNGNGHVDMDTVPVAEDEFSDSEIEQTSLMRVMERAEQERDESSVRRRAAPTSTIRDSPRRRTTDSPLRHTTTDSSVPVLTHLVVRFPTRNHHNRHVPPHVNISSHGPRRRRARR